MAAGREHTLLSTEIINRGVESFGPNTGSSTFSVRVRRRLPDFLQSVNLKYVKLGYHYLIIHGVYLATIPVLVLVFGMEVGNLRKEEILRKLWEDASYDLATVLAFFDVLIFTVSVYFMSKPRPIYLIDFACYKPADELKTHDGGERPKKTKEERSNNNGAVVVTIVIAFSAAIPAVRDGGSSHHHDPITTNSENADNLVDILRDLDRTPLTPTRHGLSQKKPNEKSSKVFVAKALDRVFDNHFDDTLDLHIEYVDLYEKIKISTESVIQLST